MQSSDVVGVVGKAAAEIGARITCGPLRCSRCVARERRPHIEIVCRIYCRIQACFSRKYPGQFACRRGARQAGAVVDRRWRELVDAVPGGVRMVATDLDGTLLSGPRHISDRAKRTIASVREGGVEVVLVSSRPPRDNPGSRGRMTRRPVSSQQS